MADEVYAWRGFFVNAPFAEATDVTSIGKRTVGGVEVNGYKLSLPNGKTATIYINPAHVIAVDTANGHTVIVTTGTQAYRRPDGVAVVPAALLGP